MRNWFSSVKGWAGRYPPGSILFPDVTRGRRPDIERFLVFVLVTLSVTSLVQCINVSA